MPQKTNLNVAPYYDDFDSDKNFYKVLFRPGYSVQTRELTSLQSILQGQIESYGKFLFKQGQQVIPGEVSLNTRLDYVKLSSVSEVAVNENDKIVYKKYDIKQLVGTKVRGLNSGVVAKILQSDYGSDIQADVIFIKYENSGDANNEVTFRQGETLEVIDGVNTPLLVVGTDGSALPTSINVTDPISGNTSTLSSPAMGFSTAVDVEEGVYFVNGFFVKNQKQLLVVDKFYDQGSAKVGFSVSENVVTPEEDASLYDNARGFSNASAPGAHRLSIDLVLSSFGYSENPDKNFIELLKIKNGSVEKKIKAADYTLLEETLARRTFDESGDYVVNEFDFSIREFYQTSGNNGVYEMSRETGLVNGLSTVEAEGKMVLTVGAGKAYVKGYEILNKESKSLDVDKGRDTLSKDNVTLKSGGLPEFNITNVYGSVPLNTVGDVITGYPTVTLNCVLNDGSIGQNGLEASDAQKSSISRRSRPFSVKDGIKTLYVQKSGVFPTTLAEIPDELWYVNERGQGGGDAIAGGASVEVIAKSIVKRLEIDPNASYLELTVVGNREELDEYLTEYDGGEVNKARFLYQTQSAMQSESGPWGTIRDYNESITPVIGLAKPKNFRLIDRGAGFNQDLDIILSKGRTETTQPYNATFGFSYFNPSFFTRLLLESNIATGTFTTGKYIYGKTSKAYGVIENDSTANYSSRNKLFVTTLYGEFIPGETIIDEGNNTIKIAKNNTISHFIVTSRGSGYSEAARMVINGVSYDQSKISVETYGGEVAGTFIVYSANVRDAKIRNLTFSTPPAISFDEDTDPSVTPSLCTAVLFKDTVLTYVPQNVKSFASTYNNYKFTADVDFSSTEYSTYDQVSDFTFFGKEGKKYIECNGFGADLTGFLIQGDIIQFTDDNNAPIKTVVQRVTESSGIEKPRVYLDASLPGDVTNTTVIRLRPRISNPTATLVFPTGSKQVASVVSDDADTKFKYYIRKDFVTQLSTAGYGLTFTAQLPVGTQRFVPFTEKSFIVTVLDKGSSTVVENGDIVYIDSKYIDVVESTVTASNVTAGALRIKDLPPDYFGTIATGGTYPTIKLTATVEVSRARPRLKTAVTDTRVVVISSGDRVIPIRGQDYDSDAIETISYSDVYKLKKVFEGTKTSPPTIDKSGNLVSGTDISYKFDFDDGQRDTYYDVSRIILKPGFDSPTGQLVVVFDYFDHSVGDFCTVDSYNHGAGVPSSEIPLFNSAVSGVVPLRDCIDFRPKVDKSTSITGFQDESVVSKFDTTDYISFVKDGGIPAATPAPVKDSTNITYTMSFSEKQYLDRIDGLFLTKKGDFIIKKGNSSLNPAKPEPVDDAVALCYLHIPAYTNSSKDVRVVPVDNKRYTMKDIGKLEKRIERLEYYTTLSILEQQTQNMQIKDSLGLEKTKSGFIVDNFESHGIGNLKSIDYVCAIDTQQSVLRPQAKEDSLNLKEINTRDDQRQAAGYVINDNVITLPYTQVELLGNKNATTTINPNPFVVIQYVGESNIYPQQDTWYDQSIAPLISDSNTKLNSIFLAKQNDVDNAYGSIYNSFIINWVGTDSSFGNIESFANINTEDIESTVQTASIASSSNVSPQNNEIGKGIATKNIGGKTVAGSVTFFARSIPIKFTVNRLKPNTQVNVFMEGRNVNAWCAADSRFTGFAGNSLGTFGSTLTTDSNGNLSGILLVPAGTPPVSNSIWTGNVDTIDYETGSEEVRFTTGEKTIRFTSSDTYDSKETADTYAEVKFYAMGTKPANPPSIISTAVAAFKANEGVQLADSNTDNPIKPNPLAQTFKIEGFNQGVMATSVDLYFKKKSSTIPIRAYLTDVALGKPGKNIIPGTQISLNPETYLRVYVTGENESVTIDKGEFVTGSQSGASGPISKIFDGSNVRVGDDSSTNFQLNKEQVYTLVLDNHNGTSFVQNEGLSIPSLSTFNNANNTTLGIFIAKDSGRVTKLNVESTGDGYESATIVLESPQLPGGSTATASIGVSDGKIYNSEVFLSGRGYTSPPSIVIKGVGEGAAGAVITSELTIDTPAVIMGVAIDNDGVTESTTPTRFNFRHPVYLSNNTEYALAIETDSLDYELWASKLGETEIATSNEVTSQPALGSVYKSQNTDNWSEDLFEDIKFVLHRAEFTLNEPAEVELTTESLGYELLNVSPFETSVRSQANATSPLFKNNNSIVKVYHRNHGFEDSGDSYVFFNETEDVGGISSATLNGRLFKVSNAGIDTYNIISPSTAGSSVLGGGSKVIASYNRKFEKLYAQIPYLEVDGTKLETFVATTNIIPVDGTTINYNSYDMSSYERTFLNEEHYFTNQKVIASDINSVINGVPNTLKYKMVLSTTNSALSPVVDLRTASVKTSSNRVENSTGYEDRYGRRDQILTFLPLYDLDVNVSGQNSNLYVAGATIIGGTSNAQGTIKSIINGITRISLTTDTEFIKGESLQLVNALSGELVDDVTLSITTITKVSFGFDNDTNVIAFNPSDTDISYNNAINGNVTLWDPEESQLVVENCYRPINGDYTATTAETAFSRALSSAEQLADVFRVGDVVQTTDSVEDPIFVEVASVSYTTGADYIPETDATNSAGVAKYVTKEVAINNPGSSVTVKTTVNTTDIDNIKVYYKIKSASSAVSLKDTNWIPFNLDGNPDFDVLATATNSISGQFEKQSDYQELSYSADDLNDFTSFAIKIVMKTEDPAYVPKIQDLRAIASF